MKRRFFGAAIVAAMIVAGACGGDAENSLLLEPAADAGTVDASSVVLVHGASLPALRLCFEADLTRLPMPSDALLPNANEVGLATGGAVRVDDVPSGAGHVYAYESTIDSLDGPSSTEPTCEVLANEATPLRSYDLGSVAMPDAGVTLLVVSGCPAGVDTSVEACGADFRAATGNLAVHAVPITAYARPSDGALPVQFLSLSPGFDDLAAGRSISVAYGSLAAEMVPFFEGVLDAGALLPDPPIEVAYAEGDLASYAEQGFRITIDGRVVLEETLADIVARSSPRDVPPVWLAAASSYVLLLLGDPTADGGRTALHFVAVPVSAR